MRLRVLPILGVVFAVGAMSCKEGPVAGELAAELTTPNTDDGAIQFTVTAAGAEITQISQGCSGCKLFLVRVSDTQYKGVVTGNISAGTLFRVGVSDSKNLSNYTVQLNSVSSRTFAVRNTLSGYSIALR